MAIQWIELTKLTIPAGEVLQPWTLAIETIGDATHLKLESVGEWKVQSSVLPYGGPDGLARPIMPDAELVLAKCPYCALIGKLGGSSAMHTPAADGAAGLVADQPFAIGRLCVMAVPSGVLGPLFVGFNAVLRPINVKTPVVLTVSGAAP